MKVIGVSSGMGIGLYPLRKYLVAALETRAILKTPGDKQWKLNFSAPLFNNYKEFIDYVKPLKPDVLIGAPDCGHSSMLRLSRAKKMVDPRDNVSLQLYIQAILDLKVEVFLMENLPKLLQEYPVEEWGIISEEYEIFTHVKSVSEWGNSQVTRKRAVIIGVRKEKANYKGIHFFKRVFPVNRPTKVKRIYKLIKAYPNLTGYEREPSNKVVPMSFKGKQLTLKEIKKIWKTEFKGKTRWEMPGTKMKNLPGVYRNLPSKFPMTVRKETRQFNQYGDVLSPREIAFIQGVPRKFEILIDSDRLEYSLNKARAGLTKSPPYEIGLWFKKVLIKYKNS